MLVFIILTACSGHKEIPTVYPTLTPEPLYTATVIATSTLTSTPTRVQPTEPLSTPTFTPFPPYPNKKVIFEYYTSGNIPAGDYAFFQLFYAEYYPETNIILYEDGLILTGGGKKILSADEMKKFFAKLDSLGFFSLESNQQHDEEDKLYNFGNHYFKSADDLEYCILVNTDKSKQLCALEHYKQFLVPEMKNLLEYFDEYKPNGLTPYYPDRILLLTRLADPNSDDMSANGTLWDKRFLSLDVPLQETRKYGYLPVSIIYIQGDMAKEIYLFWENSHSHDVFIQNGNNYIVRVWAVTPDEVVINAYQ
jgi:hypothetical protein